MPSAKIDPSVIVERGQDSPLSVAISQRDKDILETVQKALERRDVLLAFQPVVQSVEHGQIAYYEGLIRILDHTGRVIPARDFIETVETNELGRKIDCLALEMGLIALAEAPDLRLAINMSARSIGYPRWKTTLEQGLARDRTVAERLILEITESSAMVMPDLVSVFMRELQARGIAFALDDFGAGYTAFRYLREFYFDILKIDGQFIRGIADNPDNQVLAQALIAIGQHFDMFTVAGNRARCGLAGCGRDRLHAGLRLWRALARAAMARGPREAARLTQAPRRGIPAVSRLRRASPVADRGCLSASASPIVRAKIDPGEKDPTMTNVVIVSAARTPVGSFNGSFATVPAHELGRIMLEALVERAGIDKAEVSETILGQVLTAGQGQNPARQAHVNAGLPIESAAWSLNQVCGSGLRAVALAAQHVQLGDAAIVAAGGQENMTLSPHVAHLRAGQKMGDLSFIDSMIRDGLWDAFNGYHMGQTAENVANQWQISREMQDEFALASQNKAEAAQKAGKFADEIVAVTVKGRKGDTIVDADEYIRHGATLDSMQKLRPAFTRDGSVTAANASGINDGAAGVLVMSADEAERRGLEPLARIASYATAGLDPSIMGVGPIHASRKALEKAGWKVGDLDLVEANEAFAAQACAVNKDMGWDPAIVNVNGGAIAIGHPIGASGARILNTLLFEMKRRDAKKGLATLCIGGGMGVAMCLERP